MASGNEAEGTYLVAYEGLCAAIRHGHTDSVVRAIVLFERTLALSSVTAGEIESWLMRLRLERCSDAIAFMVLVRTHQGRLTAALARYYLNAAADPEHRRIVIHALAEPPYREALYADPRLHGLFWECILSGPYYEYLGIKSAFPRPAKPPDDVILELRGRSMVQITNPAIVDDLVDRVLHQTATVTELEYLDVGRARNAGVLLATSVASADPMMQRWGYSRLQDFATHADWSVMEAALSSQLTRLTGVADKVELLEAWSLASRSELLQEAALRCHLGHESAISSDAPMHVRYMAILIRINPQCQEAAAGIERGLRRELDRRNDLGLHAYLGLLESHRGSAADKLRILRGLVQDEKLQGMHGRQKVLELHAYYSGLTK